MEALNFGIKTTIALLRAAFGLSTAVGQSNVRLGQRVLTYLWLGNLGICFLSYILGAASSGPSNNPASSSASAGTYLFAGCLLWLSCFGFVALIPMTLLHLANRGKEPKGVSVTTAPQTIAATTHVSTDGLLVGEQIRWDE